MLVVARLGLGTSYAIAALISFAAAALLLAQRARTRAWLAIPAAAGIAAWAIGTPWNPLLMTAGVYFYAPWVGGTAGGLLEAQRSSRLLFYRDGLSGAVTVKERGDDRYLSVDGRGEGGTSAGSQFLLGHLPFMLGRDIRSIYVIGLGTGTTVGATTLYGPQTIEVAELEPAIVDATRYFADVNLSPLDDPRVALRLTDGRNHLLLSRPACYDAIVSQPSNPWIPGASKLFTDEFYALARSRLRSGGVLVQWVQVYNIDNQSLRALLRTFARAFPYILGFDAAEGTGELLLVGSDQPVRLDLAAVRDALADPVRRAHLARVSAGEVGSIVGRIVFGQRERAELAAQGVLNTDDNGLIEFATERSLYDPDSLALNLQYLRGFVRDPLDDLASIPAGQELHDLLASMARYSLRQDDRSRADQLALRALAHGDSATASLIAGDHWHARQRFSEAVAAWRRVIALDPANREAAQRLVRHFRGLPQAQRPAEYDGWTAIAGGTAPATATGETRPGPQQ
jgi:spermidine synthase